MGIIEELSSLDFNDIGSWTRRAKLVVASIIALLIIGAGYYFIIADQILDLEQVQQQEPRLKDQFLEKKALAINLDAYKAQMVEANEMFEVLKKQLPNERGNRGNGVNLSLTRLWRTSAFLQKNQM